MKQSILVISLATILFAGSAAADPHAEVVAAYTKAMADGSYRMNMHTEGKSGTQKTVLDVQLPDSFHMTSDQAEMIILPGGTWMNAGGQWMKLPVNMSQKMQGYSAQAMKDSINTLQEVSYIGDEDIEGCSSRHYRYAVRGKVMGVSANSDVDMWICGDTGLPAKMTSVEKGTSVTVTYDFEAPIDIKAPR